MKSCPECGTRYEGHVENCLADGVRLEDLAELDPVVDSGTPSRTKGGGVVVLLALAGLAVVVLGLVVVVGFLLTNGPSRDAQVSAPAPAPEPVEAVPAPAPPPPEPVEQVIEVAFVSKPATVTIWENDAEVCTTPCVVPHPSFAPLPRTLVFKKKGYVDETFTMTEAKGPYLVELNARRTRSKPDPAPSEKPRPRYVVPSIGDQR